MRRPKAILVIRFSSIGDIVLATSPLKSIRSAFPGARIDFLTLDTFQDILLFHPNIERLLVLRKDASRKEVSDFARIEVPPTSEGRQIMMILVPQTNK